MSAGHAHPQIVIRQVSGTAPVVSVITVCNRMDVLELCLGASLRAQRGVAFEWLIADNTAGVFPSAPAALNAAAQQATGETLLFVHQDVSLFGAAWLRELHDWLSRLPDAGVAGVIGRRAGDGGFVGYIQDRRAVTGAPVAEAVEVQTLDECVLAVPRRFHEEQPFDESLGGWHVYGVDACLRARRAGRRAYVLPLFVHHDSSAVNTAGLGAAHAAIHRLHGHAEPTIHTTCGTIVSAHTTRTAVVRAQIIALGRRAARVVGRNVRSGAHALLEEVEEQYDDILVLHFAPAVPPAVPSEVQVRALSPESGTSRPVRHRVVTPDAELRAAIGARPPGRALIVLSQPPAAPPAQLEELRAVLRGVDAAILALPDPADSAAWRMVLDSAGWHAGPEKRRGARSLITLQP